MTCSQKSTSYINYKASHFREHSVMNSQLCSTANFANVKEIWICTIEMIGLIFGIFLDCWVLFLSKNQLWVFQCAYGASPPRRAASFSFINGTLLCMWLCPLHYSKWGRPQAQESVHALQRKWISGYDYNFTAKLEHLMGSQDATEVFVEISYIFKMSLVPAF